MILDLKSVFAAEVTALPIACDLDLRGLEWAGQYPLQTPVRVEGAVSNQASVVSLALRCAVVYTAPCDRCGQQAEKRYEVPVTRTLVTRRAGEADDGDLLLLEDAMLDVDALCTEEIVLNLPRKHLCREDCRGICPTCGKNRNTGDCGCAAGSGDPRLAALQSLLEEEKTEQD